MTDEKPSEMNRFKFPAKQNTYYLFANPITPRFLQVAIMHIVQIPENFGYFKISHFFLKYYLSFIQSDNRKS